MPKKRSKEEQREYQRRYRAQQRILHGEPPTLSDVTPAVTPAPKPVTPPRNVTPAPVTPVSDVTPPYAQRPWPVGMPFAFVPMWVLHNLPPPNTNAAAAYEAHVAKTLRLTGRTPAANLALLEGR